VSWDDLTIPVDRLVPGTGDPLNLKRFLTARPQIRFLATELDGRIQLWQHDVLAGPLYESCEEIRIRLMGGFGVQEMILAAVESLESADLWLSADTVSWIRSLAPHPVRELARILGMSKSRCEVWLTAGKLEWDGRLLLMQYHREIGIELVEELQRARARHNHALAAALIRSDGSRRAIRELKRQIGPSRMPAARSPKLPSEQARPPGTEAVRGELQEELPDRMPAGLPESSATDAAAPPQWQDEQPDTGRAGSGEEPDVRDLIQFEKVTLYRPGTLLRQGAEYVELELPGGEENRQYRQTILRKLEQLLEENQT
jgi:hypothetical protein